MIGLDLPARVPLPDDVRRRALDRVLDGIDEPAPRRAPWPMAAAAAVVAALAVTVSVAVGLGRDTAPVTGPAALPPPTASAAPGSPDDALTRCATAVDGADPAAYPPTAGWRVTDTFPLGTDSVIVVDDAFACLASPDGVAVSPLVGAPMGEASAVRLAESVVAVLNPQRRTVEIATPGSVTTMGALDGPVRLILLPGVEVPAVPVTVDGSFAGALPDPAPPAVTRKDRDLPLRVPGSAQANDLELCLLSVPPWQHSRRELWQPVLVHEPGNGRPPVLLSRIGDAYAGFCTLAPDGPRFTWGTSAAGTAVLVAPSSEWDNALLAVPDGTVALEAGGAACSVSVEGGLGFCTGVDPAPGTVVVGVDAAGGRRELARW